MDRPSSSEQARGLSSPDNCCHSTRHPTHHRRPAENRQVVVYEDNSACVLQSSGDPQSSKSSHYRRDQATVEELVRSGKMWVQHCPSHLNVADIGTKIVKPIAQYEFLTERLSGYDTKLHMSLEMQKLLNNALIVMPVASADALLAYVQSDSEMAGGTSL